MRANRQWTCRDLGFVIATQTHARLDARPCLIGILTRLVARAFVYTRLMKQFIVESGTFVATTGIYRMEEHPQRERTLLYGDSVPTFQKRKVKWRLIRAAPHPKHG
jgi:hypothetical protein